MGNVLRLHLGCGKKSLPGYVNVDLKEHPGVENFQKADIRDLPWEDDSVDEVLSVHVIEHFFLYEVADLLLEWLRVLKPGGRIVIECPNLLSCAGALTGGDRGQFSMWGFYGRPEDHERQPPYLELHKWGYTPDTLCHLLEAVGFVDVDTEPAKFKFPHRDMRAAGRKPRG